MSFNIEETLEEAYAAWLDSVPGFGRKRCLQLVEAAGTPQKAYELPESDICFLFGQKAAQAWTAHKQTVLPKQQYAAYSAKHIRYVYFGHSAYPEKLRRIPDPPFGIYYKGALPDAGKPAVAMIGARRYSDYGRSMATQFAQYFGKMGVNVISGMAMGIDGISQRAALEAGGTSCAVLGCGVDIVYPPSNKDLYTALLAKGGILSEYPPLTPPMAGLFPQRNRIISALADAVLVVEAREKSGTLITVDMALEQGREVYVIPGRCTDRLSLGCNKLLRQGAQAAVSPEDIMLDMGWQQSRVEKPKTPEYRLSAAAADVLAVLDVLPCTREDIVTALSHKKQGYSVSEICQGITELELQGMAARIGGMYKKTHL